MSELAEVRLWGRTIGAVMLEPQQRYSSFEYDPSFAESGIEVSPLKMPLSRRVYRFPELPTDAFHGLPGLLADSLPDRFGNAVLDAWLQSRGRRHGSLSPIERLCYVGSRGMGALEYRPILREEHDAPESLDVGALVELASRVLRHREGLATRLDEAEGLATILQVGTSAGGARAKAVIAWNPTTDEVRSGQVDAAAGFEHWLLKFDGVAYNRDHELNDPLGYGAVEYAYSQMARAAGIEMAECRLLEEGGRRHFMTRRFDRTADGRRLHMQSLGALAHLDFNQPGAHAYEQVFDVIRSLGLSSRVVEEQYRRMVFNILARNQDDHVKNIAFLMDRDGTWSLSPAFDVTYSYNPSGMWTSSHQMTVGGKRDAFDREDLIDCGRRAMLVQGRARTILAEVHAAVSRWMDFAEETRVLPAHRDEIAANLRLDVG